MQKLFNIGKTFKASSGILFYSLASLDKPTWPTSHLSMFVAMSCGWLLGLGTPIKCLRFPGTHDDPYLQQWLSVMPGAERTPEQFGGGQMATCSSGTALLMNSRLLHCGGANLRDGARRRLFYMNLSFVKVVDLSRKSSQNQQMILWKTGSLQDFKV